MKKQSGITLISLVVTIIVLIILAGISINLILGQDGIINKAKEAKQNMELAQVEEQEQLNELYIQLETQGISPGSESYDAIVKLSEFKTKVAQAITEMGVETSEDADATTMANNIKSINVTSTETLGDNFTQYPETLTINNYQNVSINNPSVAILVCHSLGDNSTAIIIKEKEIMFENISEQKNINMGFSYDSTNDVLTLTNYDSGGRQFTLYYV